MIKLRKFSARIVVCLIMGGIFAFFLMFVSPRFLFLGKFYSVKDMTLALSRFARLPEITQLHRFLIASFVFIVVSLLADARINSISKYIEKEEYSKPKTKVFADFLHKLRFCYTTENLIEAIRKELETNGDCSVIIIDTKDNSVVYNTPTRFASDPETVRSLISMADFWAADVHFIDPKMEESQQKDARIAAVVNDDIYFFIVCRYINEVETQVFSSMFSELEAYQKRAEMVTKLLYLSELAQEWNMVATTQKSFLPERLPEVPMLELAAYFKPLVNVSGDYYYAIKIDETKTLLTVGDVSGKGLAAALIMGVIVSTIKIAKNKEDLAGLIVAIDGAIKRMNLSDKYTVLFLGLVDTEKMSIRYVNASMENPMILTESPDGYKVKLLDSTYSIVGIIDLDKIEVKERKLYRGDVIIMTTDGIPETMNDQGIELGGTEDYINSIKSFASDSAEQIVQKIAAMASRHAGNVPLRDDITILCAKVKG